MGVQFKTVLDLVAQRMRSAALGAIAFTLVAAFSNTVAATLPSWVRTPPQDTAVSMYGVGEGASFSDATQQALRSIAGKMSTRIRSDAVSRSGISGSVASRHYQETVEAYIQDIKLSAYNVVQSEMVGNRHFALVEMSRADFTRDTSLQLDTLDDELRRKLAFTPATLPLDRFLACQTAPTAIDQARFLTLVLSTADPTADATPRMRQYSAYEDQCARSLQALTLLLQSSPQFSPLAEALGQELAVKSVSRGAADARLEVGGNITKREVFNNKSVVIDLSVALLSNSSAVVSRQNYRLNGTSVVSFEAATDNALRNFLNAGGVEQVLTDLRLR